MFEPEEEARGAAESSTPEIVHSETPTGYTGETDRVNGEYHYKNGFTQKIYADAHYEPAGESTVPPRYYTPPERPVKEPKPKKEKKVFLKVACLCLVFALLGSITGAAITGHRLSGRIDALEQSLSESKQTIATVAERQQTTQGATGTVVSTGGGMSASQIYAAACEQVVGITTNVTTQNFFGMTTSSAVTGSGFIISADGYIITNYHVIEYADKGSLPITVMTHDGTKYDAIIVGTEESNDIAVLKIEASGLHPVSVGDSKALNVGDAVYAVGNPLGELEFSMSSGHVSALDRVISTEESESINMFQIDAAVNPGNSGGPVYNDRGEVVGVVTAKYSSSGVEGLGFAIPIHDAMSIANDLVTKGYVTGKAYMGVWLDERYNSMYAQYYNMPLGAYVSSVSEGSCADKAGLQAGDIITKLGDYEISSYSDLKQAVKQFSAGDSTQLTLYRAGESQSVTITFDEAVPESATSQQAAG